ncbi:microfibrillar-associated protein family protein [Schizosaccharomyces cryophilus OY26]|uniref:Microfibrillar-associated protein family protein n=1 Tax=Schizosaccharomyces cryophilus (strain OY26 / ATCC MYA-4695 / CBS 11777 / NBRC 106824 / NRRL Y48691) TaxID=653667 RepID=S9X084_SCHCR|nr:microfibrillar-associated protein family protein [Schizosaccharomyces cryophilus OY26]EPY50352.1 microfibrillar-associated protein family protein [Schizosaccharomyces cryophilus OY26]
MKVAGQIDNLNCLGLLIALRFIVVIDMAPPVPLVPKKPIGRYRPRQDYLEKSESESSSSEYEEEPLSSSAPSVPPAESVASNKSEDIETSFAKPVSLSQNPPYFSSREKLNNDNESASEYETDEEQLVTKPNGSDEEEESESESTSGSDESEEDESDRRRQLLLTAPKFVGKGAKSQTTTGDSSEAAEIDRKQLSQKILEETIQREMKQREMENTNELLKDVDDTDGLNPQGEYEAWQVRSLRRKKRDKEKLLSLEKERMSVEERRLMDPEEREKLDRREAEESRQEKKKKPVQFLQKFYHKGAFYQDQDIVRNRDYSEAAEGEIQHKELLPKAMQVRGNTFGLAGQTRWTHLANEDTSKTGSAWSNPKNPLVRQNLQRLGGLHPDELPKKRKKI